MENTGTSGRIWNKVKYQFMQYDKIMRT